MVGIMKNPISISQEILCRGKRFSFARVVIDFGDRRVIRDLLIHPGAVVIIPLLDNEHILMLKQYRPGPLSWIIELPAGTIEAGEDPRSTAERELLEETGYRAGELIELFKMYSSPGVSSEILYVFLARKLAYEGSSHQEDEAIEVIKVSLREAVNMVSRGDIIDGKTIASLLYYISFIAKNGI
ncbi:MAG: NUDIX hydrolase [Sulfolobales archaeon]